MRDPCEWLIMRPIGSEMGSLAVIAVCDIVVRHGGPAKAARKASLDVVCEWGLLRDRE